ncbi:hypothetical protein CLV30_11879 [Haloactinopolyspora alba]|uniref:Uncharacterized protein n=1 Tax=Haloactinopolyspora alba TaxID=648780 RepID=A0A2P8DPP0_9ACTN|nr:hypothetical protein [Haloactinopolyspora alba]PSK99178.1 hypothetical protein CLV30_11879 [Haloactinopolyspora alba]
MRELIASAVDKAARGDAAGFVEVTKRLEQDNWASSQEDILHALAVLVDRCRPELDATQAAELAAAVRERFDSVFAVQPIALESVVRGVAGESELLEGMPHNVLLLYALLLASELIQDPSSGSMDDVFGEIDDERADRDADR